METSVKHFKSDALRTIINIAVKEYTFYGKLKKRIPSQMCFVHRYRTAFYNVNFFTGIFQGFC